MSRLVSPSDALEAAPFREEVIDAGAGGQLSVVPAALLTPEEALRQAEMHAEEIVAAARADADRLRAAAQAERDGWQEEARATGAERGFTEGEAHGRASFTNQIDALQGVIAGIRAERTRLIDDLSPQVFGLVLAMVRRIVGEVVVVQPQVIVRVVGNAIGAVTSRAEATLSVHPDDVEHVEAAREVLRELYEDLGTLTIVGDPDLARGSCVVDTPTVNVQGTIDQALTNLGAELRDAIVVAVDLSGDHGAIDVDAVLQELKSSTDVDLDTATHVVKDALAESLRSASAQQRADTIVESRETAEPPDADAPPGAAEPDTEAPA